VNRVGAAVHARERAGARDFPNHQKGRLREVDGSEIKGFHIPSIAP
jgi:hypothetical protein